MEWLGGVLCTFFALWVQRVQLYPRSEYEKLAGGRMLKSQPTVFSPASALVFSSLICMLRTKKTQVSATRTLSYSNLFVDTDIYVVVFTIERL